MNKIPAKITTIIILSTNIFLLGCVTNEPPKGLGSYTAINENDPKKGLDLMSASAKQSDFVVSVAEISKSRNSAELIALIDKKQLPPNEADLHKWLSEIFVFFDSYEKIHNYQGYSRANTADGRIGVWHYKYIVDKNGKLHPFQIAVIDTDEGPKIMDIVVNKCVKNRHPICGNI